MPAWDFQRNVDSARILTDLATEMGLAESSVLAGTGIRSTDLRTPETVIEARQELRLIANMVENLGDIPALGLLAGQRYHFNVFGALGFAMVSSRTLHEAMQTGLRYVQLTFAFCRVELRDRGNFTHIRFDVDDLPEAVRAFVAVRDIACLVTLQRDIFSRVSPQAALHFEFDQPADCTPFETFFDRQPVFGCSNNELILDRAQLLEPMPQASELARSAAESQCEALLNQRLHRAGLSARVRQHLATRAAEMPSMDSVAQALNLIPRTLRRRLLQESTSFAELRDEVRQTLADEYLSGLKLSVEQVSERLGYSCPTSFINAYKRWHGVTPAARRSRLNPEI
ncbi:AraC family transcriptional regulator [Marinobacter mobilis]|uniref:AraC-type DNA-binding protein n=1 Tax=Marinobacter mobilis TaxID=488533 RepID=A0A1H3BFR0_9GAMM|nr:AraC family transcriptional regulator [Marinobacter mobilis]SDX40773.1 AraC-type DNA-binding protein [Marinobacter mobilis]